jgi:hypothetical protein
MLDESITKNLRLGGSDDEVAGIETEFAFFLTPSY